ncbi:MAG: hypothetical protein RMJ66_01825 [Bacteroidia bacterium]|nr:hypothetical protein [Bacteroidia bacterium]MDW8133784.1 hypothetical protein [Bacteroidia bacterium]
MKISWVGILSLLVAQTSLEVEGAGGGIYRIPVARISPFSDIAKVYKAPGRHVGGNMQGGLFFRYFYDSKNYIDLGLSTRYFSLRQGSNVESFFLVNVPIRMGWCLDTSPSPYGVWVGVSGSFLVNAWSRSKVEGVYRFADYFARSQLHVHAGIEKSWKAWRMGSNLGWDLTPAWDRMLFQSSRTLIHHLAFSIYFRRILWRLKG